MTTQMATPTTTGRNTDYTNEHRERRDGENSGRRSWFGMENNKKDHDEREYKFERTMTYRNEPGFSTEYNPDYTYKYTDRRFPEPTMNMKYYNREYNMNYERPTGESYYQYTRPYGPEPRPYGPEPRPYGPEYTRPYGPEPRPYGPEPRPYGPEYTRPYGPEPRPYNCEMTKPCNTEYTRPFGSEYNYARPTYNTEYTRPYNTEYNYTRPYSTEYNYTRPYNTEYMPRPYNTEYTRPYNAEYNYTRPYNTEPRENYYSRDYNTTSYGYGREYPTYYNRF